MLNDALPHNQAFRKRYAIRHAARYAFRHAARTLTPALVILSGIGSWLIAAPMATAQVTPDSSLSTTVDATGNNFTIENGNRVGNNLFHSFQEFSIPTNGEAFFNNAADVQNIFSRVTGGNISNIDGLIRANGGANLFLLNPAGIVFGPNARLNIGGSFIGTTADSIQFADGVKFSATNPTATPLLTIAVPIGLQMGANPGAIVNQSQTEAVGLQVPTGQSLGLIGGELSLPGGKLSAADGNIELGSVGPNSIVSLVPQTAGWTLNYQGVENFQNIQLSQGAVVDATGNIGGSIQLQGRRVSITEGSSIQSYTLGSNQGRAIGIRASEAIEVSGSAIDTFFATENYASGASGNVSIEAPYIRVSESGRITTDGYGNSGNLTIVGQTVELIGSPDGNAVPSYLSAGSYGLGQGGNITITAESLLLRNRTAIASQAVGKGDAGDLIINVQRLQLLNGTQIGSATIGAGNGGNVFVNASESVEISGSNTFSKGPFSTGIFTSVEPGSTGNGGNIEINTGRLSVLNGGKVAANLVGAGNAGNIIIRAREIEVADPLVDFTGAISGLVVSVVPGATGVGGNLDIQTDSLRVFNGGQITAATDGAGNAGNINVQARSLDISGVSADGQFFSSISARASTNFRAGSINLTSSRLSVRNGANITVSNIGGGNAGNLNISTHNLLLDNRGSLQAEVKAGDRGNINLNVRDALILRRDSSIATNATDTATGGNINLNSSTLVALENSDIIANAIQGNGGNIQIRTQGIFGIQYRPQQTQESDITASSQFGLSGTVAITNPEVETDYLLVQLPQNLLDTSQQITSGCPADGGNTFAVAGRGGLPEDPTSSLLGRAIWWDSRDLSDGNLSAVVPPEKLPKSEPSPEIVEATGWIINDKGQVELVAQKPHPIPGYNVPNCRPLVAN